MIKNVLTIVLLSLGTSCLYMANANAGLPGPATLVSDQEAATLFGGALDEYCEQEAFTCNDSWGHDCNTQLEVGWTCFRCSTDTNVEECNGDNCCIPFISCSSCIEDDPEDCGTETAGQCESDGSCTTVIEDDDECGTAFKCHTE